MVNPWRFRQAQDDKPRSRSRVNNLLSPPRREYDGCIVNRYILLDTVFPDGYTDGKMNIERSKQIRGGLSSLRCDVGNTPRPNPLPYTTTGLLREYDVQRLASLGSVRLGSPQGERREAGSRSVRLRQGYPPSRDRYGATSWRYSLLCATRNRDSISLLQGRRASAVAEAMADEEDLETCVSAKRIPQLRGVI